MHHLYLVLKDWDTLPTDDEFAFASGKKILDPTKAAEYLVSLEKASIIIVQVFNDQNQWAAASLQKKLTLEVRIFSKTFITG